VTRLEKAKAALEEAKRTYSPELQDQLILIAIAQGSIAAAESLQEISRRLG